MPSTAIFIIGEVPVEEQIYMRFRLVENQWVADLIVDYEHSAVSPPPPCYEPTEEVIEALDQAHRNHIVSQLARATQ